MRKISASYIFDGKGNLLKNGVLVLDNENKVVELIDTKGEVKEIQNLEYYNGIVCPGLINTHCHIELSYLRGILDTSENLTGFIGQMIQKRDQNYDNVFLEVEKADREMGLNGIVACGDISNSKDSFLTKSKSKIHYHTFIEIMGVNNEQISDSIGKAVYLKNVLKNEYCLKSSIVPHAVYSVVPDLLEQISDISESDSIISVHNQESEEENEVFQNKGTIAELLKPLGWQSELFRKEVKTSFEAISDKLNTDSNILFIHNVFTTEKDITLAKTKYKNRFWVFCPNSNMYISNRLPKFSVFKEENERICLGTDSLASNTGLSILEEMKTLQQSNQEFNLNDLLLWATFNGAKALKMEKVLGSFEYGKKPGVNLIYNLDLQKMKLKPETKIMVLC